jgi:hypothetical protein
MPLAADHFLEERFALRVVWTLAIVLALGGCYWGLLLLPWIFRVDVSPVAVLVFGPGYLITAAYGVRSVSTPPLGTRRLIWLTSLLVQGAWLAWDLAAMCQVLGAGQTPHEPLLPTAWWFFATVASVLALLAERGESTGSNRPL